MKVFLEDLTEAMDWSGEGAYLNVDTGNTLVITDSMEYEMSKYEELPEDASNEDICDALGWDCDNPEFLAFLRDEGHFLRLPDSYDIHEYSIMQNFAQSLSDDAQSNALFNVLTRRKPFRNFKNKVYDLGIEQQWYDYRDARFLEIARNWCIDNALEYAYRHPEKVLVKRKFAENELTHIKDAVINPGDTVFSHGYFKFNRTTLAEDIRYGWKYGDLEEIELDVELWSLHYAVDPDRADVAERPFGMPYVLEISPDRRIVTPNDPNALFLCCTLVDADRWLSWAKHAGVDKLSVFFVPMEIHSEHICAHKKEYAEYWNSKIDDMIEDVVRNQK